ncbi:sorting nexin-11 [Leuresthes tenuis]|uniref:sorting nexin-11 n=1 Tax=Leuresthes tenuis TaxID=355514 RepID=UPI003B50547F
MIRNNEEDEFVAVRVQDPRIQSEGSWNSYVDYKIFLHTNSKAFTAKTSCVRRRYSEFVWLKKKMQKNAGLVPVPDLPGKSLFSFSNEDFLETRRKGLQVFLDKVVHMTVCLSDSQLHLFLQTQLPVGHIQDCVQGLTPYSVTDAILTYASSNRGLAQAQEEDSIKEPSLTISYESMESPAPHQPCQQTNEAFSPELLTCEDSDPLEDILRLSEQDSDEMPHKERSSIRISQQSNHLEAIVEDCGSKATTFYVGEILDDAESLSPPEQRGCLIQTPVQVHSPMGTGSEENCVLEKESITTELLLNTEEKAVAHPEKENIEMLVNSEPERCVNSETILGFQDDISDEKVIDSKGCQEEDVLEDACLENHLSDVNKDCDESGIKVEIHPEALHAETLHPETLHAETLHPEALHPEALHPEALHAEALHGEALHGEALHPETLHGEALHGEALHPETLHAEVNADDNDSVQEMHRDEVEQEVESLGIKDESDEDSHSLPSSNGSIIKCSEDEGLCEEPEDSIQAAYDCVETFPDDVARWSEVEASNRSFLDLHVNGCLEENGDVSATDDEDLQRIGSLSKSPDLNPTVADGDLTESSDFRILETSCAPGLANSTCKEQEALSSLSLDGSEDTQEVEVH